MLLIFTFTFFLQPTTQSHANTDKAILLSSSPGQAACAMPRRLFSIGPCSQSLVEAKKGLAGCSASQASTDFSPEC